MIFHILWSILLLNSFALLKYKEQSYLTGHGHTKTGGRRWFARISCSTYRSSSALWNLIDEPVTQKLNFGAETNTGFDHFLNISARETETAAHFVNNFMGTNNSLFKKHKYCYFLLFAPWQSLWKISCLYVWACLSERSVWVYVLIYLS